MLRPEHSDHLLGAVLGVALAYRADPDSLSCPAIKPPTCLLIDGTAFGSRQPTLSQQLPGAMDTEKVLVIEAQDRYQLSPGQFRVLIPWGFYTRDKGKPRPEAHRRPRVA